MERTIQDAMVGRANNFDFLRFTAALMVIYTHSYVLAAGTSMGAASNVEPLSHITHDQVDLGFLAVNIFFLISGLLISNSWNSKPDWKQFLKKRVLRIYPGFVVMALLCIFLVAPHFAVSTGTYWQDIHRVTVLKNVMVLDKLELPPVFQSRNLPDQINGSIWTIKIEFECYLLALFFGISGLFKRKSSSLMLFIALWALHVALTYLPAVGPLRHLQHFASHARFLTYFASGMVFWVYRDVIPLKPSLLLAAGLILVLTALTNGFHAVMPIAGAYLIFSIAYSRRFRAYGFAKYGDFSYGLYLYAWPIQQILLYSYRSLQAIPLFIIATLCTLCAAMLSWHAVEKPSLRLKPAAA